MSGGRLLADEHVNTGVRLLRSNGYDVGVAGEPYQPGTSDEDVDAVEAVRDLRERR